MMSSNTPVRVLLIDDDEDEFVLIRDILSEIKPAHFSLEWTSDLKVARDKMIQMSHDVYLLDYRLGEISGLDLLREVVREGCRSPIILLTGYDDQDVDRDAMNIGAADYLQKNVLTSYLLERSLRYAIYRTQMRAQSISQDRMASIGLIASSLAHEIGTPLGVIRGRAELLAMQTKDNPAIRSNVEVITEQIDRVSGLIRSLLNLARGDSSEKIGPISLNNAVGDVLRLLDHEMAKQNIAVKNHLLAENPVYIYGQSEKLQQVLLNLVVNSIHAIKKARESHSDHKGIIEIRCHDLGARYSVEISDNGCGISESSLGNLFRPFFSTKNPGEGTGLGLATALWIVESWSGTIEAESQEGRGATFRILLAKGR
jgi:signal transduction histidine kinase